MANYVPVTFLNSRGETISNDPVWLAQQTLQNAGVAFNPEGQPQGADDNEGLDDQPEDYKSYDAKALKALAAERGVDIAGIKTVGQLREKLIEADKAAETTPESTEE